MNAIFDVETIYRWVVSNWLAEKLSEHSKPILESEYGVWWGRATPDELVTWRTVPRPSFMKYSVLPERV